MNLHHLIGEGVAGFLAQDRGSFWMPPPDSTAAAGIDRLFYFILWLSVFFFIVIVGLMLFFIIKYRARDGHAEQKTLTHHTALEITWTLIPLILVLFIFYFGFTGYVDMYTPPANAYEIQVTGMKWKWLFTYSNGHVDENLHVPIDRPVRLVMTSDDVIHSLFIPNFRLKLDVVPGRYSKTWFEANEAGEFDIFCAEYCGTGHSDMHTFVVVHPTGEFEQWLEKASDIFKDRSLSEVGQHLYKSRGCAQCHSLDGTAATGPSFKGVFGHEVKFRDGSSKVADENYVRESVLNPGARVVAGYQNVMPTFQGKLTDKEITAIIEYLKTLSDHPTGEGSGGEAANPEEPKGDAKADDSVTGEPAAGEPAKGNQE